MSYTSGIVSPQQAFEATEATAAASTNRAARTGLGTQPPGVGLDGMSGADSLDRANWSTTAGMMAQALSGSDVRADSVAPLQQAIAAGTYSVSSSDVAGRLIDALMQ